MSKTAAQTEEAKPDNAALANVLGRIVDRLDAADAAQAPKPDEPEQVLDDGKKFLVNTKGETLMAKFTLARKQGAPDPLCITVGENYFWMKRGIEVVVPFYLVLHMKNNIETHYRQEKDEYNKNVIRTEQSPSESFNYSWIDPDLTQPNAKYL